jgi:hypothetical protein
MKPWQKCTVGKGRFIAAELQVNVRVDQSGHDKGVFGQFDVLGIGVFLTQFIQGGYVGNLLVEGDGIPFDKLVWRKNVIGL